MLQQTISHYRLLYNVGSSLLGEVYLAEDQQLGRKVALLFLPEPFSRDPEQMRRLLSLEHWFAVPRIIPRPKRLRRSKLNGNS